ncbi:MAG: hypothetical protein BWZ10_02430 [candidate division BRC1 bacterium ADurb.BinA364]|nr:MAG: hypothetical protein BWZ10_02430 [candidate division BRC1 bacterium ADurb.BinA364]
MRARLADAEETAEDRAPANNARALLLDNREKQYHILFLCGRPNWENAFIRRAAEMDRQLKLTSLVRVSGKEREFKYRGDRSSLANPLFEGFDASRELPRYDESVFIRLGAEEQELIGGYPDRLEDLFPYHLIVWSEIEAEFFSLGQMEATRDYVRQRGGALLLLGGPRSLGQGGYAGTPIEALLPARLLADSSLPPDPALQPFQADPALEGLASGVWSLDPDPEKNASLWKEGPALYGLNPLALIRPGAAMAARASSQSRALDGLPLFVSQRYGLGRGAILASYATWPWRMGVEPEDERHERFWRQLARSLCRETPDAIEARGKQDSYPVGAPVRLEFLVRDRRFESREGLEATAIVRGPGGEILAAAVEESIEESGVYAVEFAPEAPGAYRIEFAPGTTENPPAREEAILATPDRREFDNARYDPEYLRRLARAVGGEFVPLEELGGAFEKIPWRPSQQAEYGRARLWSWPGFYLVLAALALAEWLWRRRRGQA